MRQRGQEFILAFVGRRTWYCLSRARKAERVAVISAMVRTGRSTSVTLPRCSTARCTSSESAPLRVKSSMGMSDQVGCDAT
jgi:hypothetical protein